MQSVETGGLTPGAGQRTGSALQRERSGADKDRRRIGPRNGTGVDSGAERPSRGRGVVGRAVMRRQGEGGRRADGESGSGSRTGSGTTTRSMRAKIRLRQPEREAPTAARACQARGSKIRGAAPVLGSGCRRPWTSGRRPGRRGYGVLSAGEVPRRPLQPQRSNNSRRRMGCGDGQSRRSHATWKALFSGAWKSTSAKHGALLLFRGFRAFQPQGRRGCRGDMDDEWGGGKKRADPVKLQ